MTERLATLREILEIPVALGGCGLVTLAACETAVTGTETIQADYVGLASAFLKAGASAVLSTLWTVESVSNA